ncbi:hypothetical protein F4804DRAFT_40155 [Jackrogersella minutella]|nr:hypothetical protein F4804DRAFT_40155 [Jackrogersella minutella]
MDRKRTRRSRVQIPVPSKPPPYRLGDGPPLAPLSIVPENDSTAFIVDKRVQPSTARNGESKLHMYYVVGWRDLPAARVAILATEVHDYVSPREVEDFEYRALLERDEESERQEMEKKLKATIAAKKKQAKLANATGTPAAPSTPPAPHSKKRGRPSKAELQARRPSQRANFINPKPTEVLLPPESTSGPSLSTPQKKRAKEIATDVEDIDETDEADPDDAIYRQLLEDGDNVEDTDVDSNDEDEEYIPLNKVPKTMSSGLEIRSYAKTLWLNKDATLYKHTNGSLALKSPTSNIPIPKVLQSNKQLPPPPPPPKPLNGQPRKTRIPVPPPFTSDKIIPTPQKHSQTPIPVPTSFGQNKKSPRPKLKFDNKQSTTPVPVPLYPRLMNRKTEPPASAPPLQPLRTSPRHHGFTPAGRSSGKWPSAASQSPRSRVESPLNNRDTLMGSEGSSRPKRRLQKPKPKPREEEKGRVWVVERLEGDKLMNINGRRGRFFKVRWEGEWPPDQNPTWEPEENIAPGLVKQYLKKKYTRHKTATSDSSSRNDTPDKSLAWHSSTRKRKYSSLAEAFAGDTDDLDELRNSADRDEEAYVNGRNSNSNYDNEDDGEDEILAVTTEKDSNPARRASKPKPRPDELGAAFMRDLAAAIHRKSNRAKADL